MSVTFIAMNITRKRDRAAWLLLTFTLPKKSASQRVEVWRKLQRYGSIPLGNSGYLLPNDTTNRERFEWLATAIRKYSGEASVVRVQSIDNLSTPQLVARFSDARSRDYQELILELQKLKSIQPAKRSSARLSRIRGRFVEIAGVDFFKSHLQERVKRLVLSAGQFDEQHEVSAKINPREYAGRLWVTRPRPGIDRSASAWLIQRFIDKKARFVFAAGARVPVEAVPYDMFQGGFGHRSEDCTFETLRKVFGIHDRKVELVGEIIHDADLLDGKFGRTEGFGLDAVLKGWAKRGVPDSELLALGIQLIDGLYHSVSLT